MKVYLSLADDWTRHEFVLLRRILNADGTIRVSKPNTDDEPGRMAAYVWRMLMWSISDDPKHQCMPVMCFYELPGPYAEKMQLAKGLDHLVDKILTKVPPHRRYLGISAWIGLV